MAQAARGEWGSASADLVGHRQPVTVVRFSPALFAPEPSAEPSAGADDKAAQPRTVVAVGSQDATVSVWTNTSDRPLVLNAVYTLRPPHTHDETRERGALVLFTKKKTSRDGLLPEISLFESPRDLAP